MVNEQVAQPHDSSPLDLRPNGARLLGKASNGLANVLEIPQDCVKENLVGHKLFQCLLGKEAVNLFTTLDDVEKGEVASTQP